MARAAAVVVTAGSLFFPQYAALLTIAGVAISAWDARQQQKKLKGATSSFRERTLALRTTEGPARFAFGRARVPVTLVYFTASGPKNEWLYVVQALAWGEAHEIQDVMFDDVALLLGADGKPAPPPQMKAGFGARKYLWTRTYTETHSEGAPGATITLRHVPVAIDSVSVLIARSTWVADPRSGGEGGGTGTGSVVEVGAGSEPVTLSKDKSEYFWAQGSNTVKVNRADAIGKPITITYRREEGGSVVTIARARGTADGYRDTVLEQQSQGQWTPLHLGRGIAQLHSVYTFDSDIFAGGLPNPTGIGKWQRVLDPRTNQVGWSANPVLIIRHYMLMSRLEGGFGYQASDLIAATWIEAANICDELVPYGDGTKSHARYEMGGWVNLAGVSPAENVKAMLTACLGTVVDTGGRLAIYVAAYRTPAVEFTEDDLADGAIEVQPEPDAMDRFNGVKGLFQSEADAWQDIDFPAYRSDFYRAQDGGVEVLADFDFPFTQDAHRAQRMAKLLLHRARSGLIFKCTQPMIGSVVTREETAMWTIARRGWDKKVFRLVNQRLLLSEFKVENTWQEDGAGTYAWNYQEGRDPDPAPNSLLPDVSRVQALRGLRHKSGASTYDTLPDGTVIPYALVQWDAIVDDVGVLDGGRIDIYWKRAHSSTWSRERVEPTQTEVKVSPVSRGETLNVRGVVVNGAGAKSVEMTLTFVVAGDVPVGGARSPATANQLTNAAFATGLQGWVVGGRGTRDGVGWPGFERATGGVAWNDTPIGGQSRPPYPVAWFPIPATGSPEVLWQPQRVPCKPGERMLASINTVPAGWRVRVQLTFFNAAGQQIDAVSSDPSGTRHWYRDASGQGGAGLGGQPLPWDASRVELLAAVMVAPAGAASCDYAIFSVDQEGFDSDFPGIAYIEKPFLGPLEEGAVTRPPWDAGIEVPQDAAGGHNLLSGAAFRDLGEWSGTGLTIESQYSIGSPVAVRVPVNGTGTIGALEHLVVDGAGNQIRPSVVPGATLFAYAFVYAFGCQVVWDVKFYNASGALVAVNNSAYDDPFAVVVAEGLRPASRPGPSTLSDYTLIKLAVRPPPGAVRVTFAIRGVPGSSAGGFYLVARPYMACVEYGTQAPPAWNAG